MKGKTPSQTQAQMIERVMPGNTNAHNTVFGGKVMEWIDIAAGVPAGRHAQTTVVTASVDRLDFHAPARAGDIMILTSWVNYTGRTSIEVEVRVESEDPFTGKRELTTDAFLTFVAIDDKCRPTAVPPLIPESDEEKKRFEEGKKRAAQRAKERKNKKKNA